MQNEKILKDCPYCGEEILAKAIKCKHCLSFIEDKSKTKDNIINDNNQLHDSEVNKPELRQNEMINSSNNNVKGTILNKNKSAIASLVLGVVGIPLMMFPTLNYIIHLSGVIFGAIGLKSEKRGMAIAGIIICSLSLFISVPYSFSTYDETPQNIANKPSTNNDYSATVVEVLSGIEEKQLSVSIDSSMGTAYSVHVSGFAMIADIEQIDKVIDEMDYIIRDTSAVISKLKGIKPPIEHANYHNYYIEVLEGYNSAIRNKRTFYSVNRFEAVALSEMLSEGESSAYTLEAFNELTKNHEFHKSEVFNVHSQLRSATTEFRSNLR